MYFCMFRSALCDRVEFFFLENRTTDGETEPGRFGPVQAEPLTFVI